MFVSMKSMLSHANEHNYAVMAANCVNMELVKAIIGAAQEENAPVIVNISPRQMKAHAVPELLVPMIKTVAESVDVPVALNLDHGQQYEDVVRIIRAGYTSIMFDGSSLPYEQNVEKTRLITLLAHDLGLSVEAELGHVGLAQNGDNVKESLYTDPKQAKDFIERTGADCLAVAIGTAHGSYPKNMKPKLDFERLKLLKEELKMPLVLHGGSGAGADNIRKAVSLGINKINVCTDLFSHGRRKMILAAEKNPMIDYMDIQIAGEKAMKEYVKKYMKMIGSSNRYCDLKNEVMREVE